MHGTLFYLAKILDCPELSATDTLLMVAIADHVNSDGETFVGIETLARKARCSYPTAKRRLRDLEERGFLARTRRRKAGGNLSTYSTEIVADRLGIITDPRGPHQGSPGRSLARDHLGDPAEVPRVEVPSKDLRSTSDVADEFPPEAVTATKRFAAAVIANGHTVPKIGTKAHRGWYVEMDRLLRLGPPGDGQPPPDLDTVLDVIGWMQADVRDGPGFPGWGMVVRSPGKFREQWTRLAAEQRRTARPKDNYEDAFASLER